MVADLILTDAKAYTADARDSFAEAVAVKGDRILEVGGGEVVRMYRGAGTRMIGLGGRLVLPGIHDAHAHAAYAGACEDPLFCDTRGCATYEEFGEALRAASAKLPPGAWLRGGNLRWDIKGEGTKLARGDVDACVTDRPVFLSDGGLHRFLLNSAALAACGVGKATPDLDPAVGRIERDAAGEPTGVLVDFHAQTVAMRNAPEAMLSPGQLEEAILRAQRAFNRFGVTTHVDIAGPGGDWLFGGTWGTPAVEAYARLARSGRLTCRVALNVLAGLEGVQSLDAIAAGLSSLRLPDFGDPMLVGARAVKIFGDLGWRRPEEAAEGRLGNCTFPGATDEERGEHLMRALAEAHRRGWQAGVHMVGGRGIDYVVRGIKEAQQAMPGKHLRHFIIHGDELSPENVRDCARHGIALSAQAVAPRAFIEAAQAALRPGVGYEVFDYRAYQDAGVVVAQGSDAPGMEADWLNGLEFLVARKTRRGDVVGPGKALTLTEALRMYTINGAWQNHMDLDCGSIEAGKLADFAVMEDDLFAMPPGELSRARVAMTFMGGKAVYGEEPG